MWERGSGCHLRDATGRVGPSPGSSHLHVEWLGLDLVAPAILSTISFHGVERITMFFLLACLDCVSDL